MPSPADELRTAIVTGRAVRRGGGEPAAEGDGWGEERQLPADLLYELLVNAESGAKPRAAVLVGLRITGRLNLESADLQAPLIAHGCHFDAPVNMLAAKAPEITLTACHLPALAADRLETRGTLDLSMSTAGVIGLLGASIGGDLAFAGTVLTGGSYLPELGEGRLRPPESPAGGLEGVALAADRVKVGGNIFCIRGFTAEAAVRLLGAHIGGQLAFNGATLGGGLDADGLEVGRGLFFTEGFRAGGEVRLFGAHIGNLLALEGAILGGGLAADGLQVDGDMFARAGFTAEAAVRLLGAHIRGQVAFNGATLGGGLEADGLRVEQSMFCIEGFSAGGGVRLLGAHIGRQLAFEGAALMGTGLALDLEEVHVGGALILHFANRPVGGVDLTRAHVGSLFDSESTWPPRLLLGGCEYAAVTATEDSSQRPGAEGEAGLAAGLRQRLRLGGRPDVRRRLRWIRLAEEGTGYAPSPYAQLMAFYRREGRDGDARRVAYERERRRGGELGLPGKTWNAFLRWTVGYGYKPLRALVLLAGLVIVGSLAFSSFHDDGSLTATSDDHQPFLASIYTLDRLVPVVSLGLRDAFAPSGAAQWWALAYTLLGWLLTVAVVAGVNAAVRRD